MLDKLSNSIKGSGRGISRDDLRRYALSDNESEKQKIELDSLDSDFDTDAFEGWESLGFETGIMSKLDQRHLKNVHGHSFLFWIGASIILVTGIILVLQYKPTPSTEVNPMKQSEFQIEETDIIPAEVINLPEIPESIQIKSKELKNDFKERKTKETQSHDIVETIPTRLPEPFSSQNKELISKRKHAPEIYLEDFKLIDYSTSNRDEIQTKRLILYGTPADQEEKLEVTDQFNWENYSVSYNEFMDKTMLLLSNNNYKMAVSRLKLVATQFPMDLNAHFYLGFSYYNLGLYHDASNQFDICLQGSITNFDQEALWFKALSLEQSGKKTEAKQLFRKITNEKGFYSEEARKKLNN